MIELQNIQYNSTKGETLLKLDHQFELNQFHVILGPSGAGKTILLELLAGLVQPNQGELVFEGSKVTNLFPEVRKFGYLPQDNVLFPHLTVRQNVEYSLKIKGTQNQPLVEELANRLKINHLLDRKIDFLSGGEIQRVALVRSMVAGNKVLLLDEPTAALDPALKNELCYLLKEIRELYQLTIIMVTHDIEVAYMVSDQLVFLMDGQIQQTTQLPVVKFVPASLKVAQFIGGYNLIKGHILFTNQQVYFETNGLKLIVEESYKSFLSISEITLAIAATELNLVKSNEDLSNVVQGKIKRILQKQHSVLLFFEPINTNFLFEIELNHQLLSLPPPQLGDEIYVQFPVENLYLLS
jgi:ABC-type sugar transport system ATPase subunit